MGLEVRDFRFQFMDNEGNQTAVFEAARIDQSSGSTQYFGYVSLDGRFLIQRRAVAAGVITLTYAYGATGFTTAWTGRAALSYHEYFDLRANVF